MNQRLTIKASWEHLAKGLPEEQATYAALGFAYGDVSLTEAEDTLANRLRQDVHLSAYRLAEWFAWHWWRLRWEPRRAGLDWTLAHHMPSIGGGYVWPNMTIFSDGERIVLNAQPTSKNPAEPLRYIAQTAAVVTASEFETEVDLFLYQVLERLRAEGLSSSNLETVWLDLQEERSSPKLAKRRKLEALLGNDVDEANEADLEQLLIDADKLGDNAFDEVAAQTREGKAPLTSAEIEEIASKSEFSFNPKNVVQLVDKSGTSLPSGVAAWRRGVAAAKALRQQESLGEAPISNERLSDMMGVAQNIEGTETSSGALNFSLSMKPSDSKIALRSKYPTGRRFALSRLLGDHIAYATNDKLRPVTDAYTYRQKMQRAFAGEFLCPFDALSDQLGGNFGEDRIDEAAEYFNVSNQTVKTMLTNHGILEREEFAMIA